MPRRSRGPKRLGAGSAHAAGIERAFAQLHAVLASLPTEQGHTGNAEGQKKEGNKEASEGRDAASTTGTTGPVAEQKTEAAAVDRAGDGSGANGLVLFEASALQQEIQEQLELAMELDGDADADFDDPSGDKSRKQRAAKLAAKIHGGLVQKANASKPRATITKPVHNDGDKKQCKPK